MSGDEQMANQQDTNQRRERINQSSKVLPGDQERARDEEREDFDASDSGSLGTRSSGQDRSNPAERRAINRSAEVLPGDQQRARDDEAVDSGSTVTTRQSKDALEPDHIIYRP